MRWLLSGSALPWDVTTRRAMHRWRFEPDSIVMPGKVWLLRDHDNAQRIGYVEHCESRPGALWVRGLSRVWVATGAPLSVSFEMFDFERENGVVTVKRAALIEVSVVKRAAFAAARIETVEAG